MVVLMVALMEFEWVGWSVLLMVVLSVVVKVDTKVAKKAHYLDVKMAV